MASQDSEQELRELARENPDEFRRVAERYGGAISDRMFEILDEELAQRGR